MSSDPNDFTALTPGHFLIGEPLTAPVDTHAKPMKASLLTRWKLVSHLNNEFWKRWSSEYLHELQHRFKWKQQSPNIQPGTIVVIKEENTPVMKWPLGRVVGVHKGEDGCVRVVDVRTTTGIFKRPIHKLAPLPCEENTNKRPSSIQEDQPSQGDQDAIQTKRPIDDQNIPGPSIEGPKKKMKRSLGSSILTVLMTCLILPNVTSEHVNITQFGQEFGIHFEDLGTTKLITSDWKLIVYYDLHPYWMELDALKNGTYALQHLCKQIMHKSTCSQIVTQFQHLQDELIDENEMLSTPELTKRPKRGAVDVVGNVANSLFGILDQKYAEQMANTIDSIKENEDHLMTLLKNQTSVVDSTINVLKRDRVAVKDKFAVLDHQITQIINRLNGSGEREQQTKLYQQFVSLALQMTLITNNLQRIQSAIIDVITDTRHGRMNPLLLSPHQLTQEVSTIRNHLLSTLRLPTKPENLLELYKVMVINSRIINNYVIFQLNLPLVLGETFNLLRVLPIPVWTNNSFVAIQADSPFLAITPHRDHYYPIEDKELASCTLIEGTTYLCKQLRPIYRRGARICTCEVELLNNAPRAEGCNFTQLLHRPIWIQLSHANEWIFAYNNNTSVNVVCDDEAFSLMLHGSGLLTIDQNCILKENLFTIHGHRIYFNTARTAYTRLGISTDSFQIDKHLQITNTNHTYHPHLEELKNLHEQITALDLSSLPKKVHGNTIHHFSISYLALFISGIVIICFAWRYGKTRCNQRPKKPQAAPRQQTLSNHVVNV